MSEYSENMHDELHDAITRELGKFISSKAATFACGGSITIGTSSTETTAQLPPKELINTKKAADDIVCLPISLRWDSLKEPGVISKLTFPVAPSKQEEGSDLLKLVHDGQSASFGFNGENVLDDSYRKAIKLDRSTFSVDFCPYETGIIDTVAQLLLPTVHEATKGVKAELYKLNIYNAPSGFFKPHVDTPRSSLQFGSLVVALPCHHEGGQLVVRHADQCTTFDWSASSSQGKTSSAVQWAAFYSDCEHEVKEVTEGHRITLTYNLYYTLGVGDLTGRSPAMDVTSLPLYHKVNAALEAPSFMAEGGILGIYCQHAYAHSTYEGIDALPGALKGIDMAVYTIFLALGLHVSIRPVLELDDRGGDPSETDFIGRELAPLKVTNLGGHDGSSWWEPLDDFGGDWLEVNWLNSAQHPNIGFVHATYGNEVSNTYKYTYAALLVKVPPKTSRVNSPAST